MIRFKPGTSSAIALRFLPRAARKKFRSSSLAAASRASAPRGASANVASRDFVLLEMNHQAGGNARWGENEITAYPWAAHYVPVPGPKGRIRPRTIRRSRRPEKWPVGRARSLFLAAGASLPLRPLAGRHRAGHRPNAKRSRPVSAASKISSRNSGQRTNSPFPWNLAAAAKYADFDRLSFADWLQQQGCDSRL